MRPDQFIAWRIRQAPTSPAAALIRVLDRVTAQPVE
ncbi:hypothetical protein [Nocardia sp. NBC_01503]